MPKMFGMKFPQPLLKEAITYGTTTSIPVGTTAYLRCTEQVGLRSAIYSLVEGTIGLNYLATRPGILNNLVFHSANAPGALQTYVCTVRINGAPTAITCTISGAASQDASNLVNNAVVAVGDRVTVQVVTSAAAALSVSMVSLGINSPSTRIPFEHNSFSSGITPVAVNTTTYLGFNYRNTNLNSLPGTEISPPSGYLISRKGTLKNLAVLAEAAPGVGESFVYTVRVNAVATALTVTLSGGVAVSGNNAVNVVPIKAGDRVTVELVTSLVAAVTIHAVAFDFSEGDYRAG